MAKRTSFSKVSKKAIIEEDVIIHPFVIIEEGVKVGKGTEIYPFVQILKGCEIGKNNQIFSGCALGVLPFDLKYQGEDTYLKIGDNNIIHEGTTISKATGKGEATIIGSNNFIMAYCHIAHNCKIGNHNIITNHTQIGGHCEIFDYVNIGGSTGLHQYVRVGSYGFVGAFSYLKKDLLPFMIGEGNPFYIFGINTIGLKKANFSKEKIEILKKVYRIIYHSRFNLSGAIEYIKENLPKIEEILILINFIKNSQRGICLKGIKSGISKNFGE